MLIARPIRNIRNHEQQHVSDSESDQGPPAENQASETHRRNLPEFQWPEASKRTCVRMNGTETPWEPFSGQLGVSRDRSPRVRLSACRISPITRETPSTGKS